MYMVNQGPYQPSCSEDTWKSEVLVDTSSSRYFSLFSSPIYISWCIQ